MILFAWIQAAFAASVYLNGVRADILPEVTLTNVTVRVDAQGNLWIDAPAYRVALAPSAGAAPVAQPPPAAAPLASAPPAAAPLAAAPLAAAPLAAAPPAPTGGVASGVWWLVTEDNGSTGQVLDVVVNGTIVRRILSGEPQVILDVGPFLRPGVNALYINASPGTAPVGGGVLNVYVGRGVNNAGTIRIDAPDVRYSRRASDGASPSSRPFTITVQ